MRELGFRVWDKETEEYLHITKNKEDGVVGISPDGKKVLYLEDGEVIILEDVIIEQDTGLKDKNGKKIYEGGIVKVVNKDFNNEGVGVIKYDVDNLAYYLDGLEMVWAGENEVIGNIHENEELLKGEE